MIVVERVSKYYGQHAAVRDLDFTIEQGECVGFLGLNGAGKSTTLRLLSCLLLPTAGRIKIRGFDAEDQPHEIRKLIGFLPDKPPLYPEMDVTGYLRFAGRLRRMNGAQLEKRLPEVLDLCGLERVSALPINNLSHGYQQRVGIAQAIIHKPSLLILDEPIQGLDPVQIVEMRKLIRSLRGQHTILLSSHILSEVERTCDRLLMLSRGKIVAEGSEEEVVASMSSRPESATTMRTTHWVDIEVRGERKQLEGALALADVEISEIGAAGDGVVRAKLRSTQDERQEVAAHIVNNGLGLLMMRRSSSALEDVFVQMSREDDAEEESAAKAAKKPQKKKTPEARA